MALNMNSPLGFSSPVNLRQFSRSSCSFYLLSQVNLRQFSRSCGSSNQQTICASSFIERKHFVEVAPVLSLGSRVSLNDVRWSKILRAADSNQTSTESGVTETRDAIANPSDPLSSSDVPSKANSNQVSTESGVTETRDATANPSDPLPSSDVPSKANGTIPPQKQEATPKRSPLTARERLRAARVLSRYNEVNPKPPKPEMGRSVLDAIRESDKGKKKPGLPEAPDNLFDDSKRGMPKAGLTFNLPVGGDLLVIIVSFVTITTIMFTTTYVVWKLGAIHFNEY